MSITEAVSYAVIVLPAASMVASALSAAIPDPRLGIFAKFVNALALNVGHAKNAQPGCDCQDKPVAGNAGQNKQG